jgi:hypothetical protein
MNNRTSWKSAFFVTLKQTKFPILFRIIGYWILFVLAGKIVAYFGYQDDFLMSLILVAGLLFLGNFCFILVQNKK